MKQRRRKYADGDYGHKRWPRGKPVLQVSMAIEPTPDTQDRNAKTLRFVFHGAYAKMLNYVFWVLRGRLFDDFRMTEYMVPIILNGKCYRSLIIQIEQPDFHRLSLSEWPLIIRHLMERTFRCQVTYFDNFDKFLNT